MTETQTPAAETKTSVVRKSAARKVPAKPRVIKKTETPSLPAAKMSESASQLQYLVAIGKRKTAVANIKLMVHGSGKITVNEKEFETFFFLPSLREIIRRPLELSGLKDSVDVVVRLNGGGMKSQADALRLALTRVLVKINADMRPVFRGAGLLTRDARKKERKKFGLKRARKAPQWAKR